MRIASTNVSGASWKDADAAYAVKMELQAKVDSLDKDIKFLKCLYDAVRTLLSPHPHPDCFSTLPGRCQQERFRINTMKDVLVERSKSCTRRPWKCRMLVLGGHICRRKLISTTIVALPTGRKR